METPPRTARQVADDLVDALARQRELAVRQADLVAELVDLYDTVTDVGPMTRGLPGVERLRPSGHDGTPLVAEFLPVELAPLLRTSVPAASALVRDVMDLRERLPYTWAALHEGRVEWRQARQIARETGTAELCVDAARWVDERLASCLGRLPWARVKRKLSGLIVSAEPEFAARRAERARSERFVRIRHERDGMSSLFARLDTPGAVLLESAIDALARSAVPVTRVTVTGPSTEPMLDDGAGGATVAGAGLIPAVADEETSATGTVVDSIVHGTMGAVPKATVGDPRIPGGQGWAPSKSWGAPGPIMSLDDVPGVDLETRRVDALIVLATPSDTGGVLPRPACTMVVHLAPGSAVARGEGEIGPLLMRQVKELLRHHRVTVLPVIDLADDPQVDAYEIPARIRRQVLVRDPFEVFPYSTTRSAGCDLDHTDPYDQGKPAGQTRPSNLGPLSRLVHRAKTHGGWKVTQPAPGVFQWTSPLGYRYTVARNGTTNHTDTPHPDTSHDGRDSTTHGVRHTPAPPTRGLAFRHNPNEHLLSLTRPHGETSGQRKDGADKTERAVVKTGIDITHPTDRRWVIDLAA
ncbi:DUF222 domain-containing protein [Propioniciclava sp.]|uniref:DUF222 domain-containing protein n=1 Tax=Propioniciclava sp. TaxID=2038686 RepID=UPI0039E4DD4F